MFYLKYNFTKEKTSFVGICLESLAVWNVFTVGFALNQVVSV